MIEGIWQIGKEVLKTLSSDEELVEKLVLDIPEKIRDKKQYIVILKLQTSPPKFEVDLKETGKDTSREYLWLGNPPAAMLPQDRFTTNHLEYLVSQTVSNLIERLPDSELKESLWKLKEKIYFDLGTKKNLKSKEGQFERYRYIWDLSNLGFKDLTPKKIRERAKKSNSPSKEAIKIITSEILKHIKGETKLSKNEIALYTLEVNGEILVQDSRYKRYIFRSLIEEVFADANEGFCHLCGECTKVTGNTTKFKFKFYMTDKIGFSSGLEGNKTFAKNYALCQECYKAIIAAEPFIRSKLHSRLARSNVYIIPSFHLKLSIPIKKLNEWAEYLTNSFNAARSLEEWHKFQEKIEDYGYYERQKDNFSLNFLFWRPRQAEFKILRLIQDISPGRLDILTQKASEVLEIGNKLLGESIQWYLSLGKMFYLFPVRKAKNEIHNEKVLEFYDSLFSGIPISYSFLIKEFAELTGVYYFEKFPAYVISSQNSDIDMCQALLLCNFLLLYLKKLNLLKGGEPMGKTLEELQLSSEEAKFIKEMGYSESKIALFLLGNLVGKIGTEQYKQGAKKKPILNKLNFQAMRLSKIIRLANDIFEKMKQYKVLSTETEKNYSIAKMLLDKHSANWPLTAQENVFYILSGYAFGTYKAITSKKDKNKVVKQPEAKEV